MGSRELAGRGLVDWTSEEAVNSMRRVLELQPENAWAWSDFGESLRKQGLTESYRAQETANSRNPDYARAFERKGKSYALSADLGGS